MDWQHVWLLLKSSFSHLQQLFPPSSSSWNHQSASQFSLALSFALHMNKRALALATCLTAAVKMHMDEQDFLILESPFRGRRGIVGWRRPEVSPTTSHTTSNLSLLQFVSSGAWKPPLFSLSCWHVLSTALLDLLTSWNPPWTPKLTKNFQ